MSSIVYLKNKKSGKIYAYLNESVWDKETKRCICKRKCIGYLNPETGEILQNRQRREKEAPTVNSVGFSMLFEQVCEKIGLTDSLRAATPKNWKRVLTCAQYIVAKGNRFSGCQHWAEENLVLSNDVLTPKGLQNLFSELTEEVQDRFFQDWIERQGEKDFEMMNTVSISSYDEGNDKIRAREALVMEDLSKMGLCVFIGAKKRLPLYLRQSPGVIMGADTLSKLVDAVPWVDSRRTHLIVDREFSDANNIEHLYRKRNKFVARTYPEFELAHDSIIKVKDNIMSMENFRTLMGRQLFVMSFLSHWKGYKCYTHIFFDSREAENQFSTFLTLMEDCRHELESGEILEEHEYLYETYFMTWNTPEGKVVELNSEAMMKYNDVAGYMVLISSNTKDPAEALNSYLEKDRIEAMFDDIRNEEDNSMLKLYLESSFNARLFLQFIALVVTSEIWRAINKRPALAEYTLRDIIEEMSKIKRIVVPGQKNPIHTKVSTKQMEIMSEFGIDFLFEMQN